MTKLSTLKFDGPESLSGVLSRTLSDGEGVMPAQSSELTQLHKAHAWDRELLRRQMDGVISDKDAEISALRMALAERDHLISMIYKSRSWSMCMPYRMAGRCVLSVRRLVILLFTSPRQFAKMTLWRAAEIVRKTPVLRRVSNRLLALFPSKLREILVRAAPPTAQQAGHRGAPVILSGLGGEWQWIYNEIRSKP